MAKTEIIKQKITERGLIVIEQELDNPECNYYYVVAINAVNNSLKVVYRSGGLKFIEDAERIFRTY